MKFYEVKQNLIDLANKLFTYTPNKLTSDIDLKGKFDHINVDVYGAASLSPKQQFEIGNLNYNRDEQGRDYFSSFLTLVIQSGVRLGFDQKEEEIRELKNRLDTQKELADIGMGENYRLITELKNNVMPKGALEDEIRELRKQIRELKEHNSKLSEYKRIVDTMKTSLKFIENK